MTAPLVLAAALLGAADPPAVAPPPRPADPLPDGAVARMGTRLFRHPGYVATLAFALDGRVLVSVGDNALTVWDARTGRPVREIGTPRGRDDRAPGLTLVRSVGVRADGKTLFAYADRTVAPSGFVNRSFVWDLERDAEVRSLHVGLQPGRRMHAGPDLFAPDGSVMAEQDWDDVAWLWDGNGNPTGNLDAPATSGGIWRPGRSGAFGPDGRTLYLGGDRGSVAVWDAAKQKFVRLLDGGRNWWSFALAVSADGRRVAVVGGRPPTFKKDGPAVREVAPGAAAVRVWDPEAGRVLVERPWDGVELLACTGLGVGFLPDGALWVAGVAGPPGADHSIRFRQWDPKTGEVARDWKVPAAGGDAGAIAVSADGARVAVGFASGAIRVFDAATGRDLSPGSGHGAGITDLRFTPDGSRLITAAGDGTARAWDAATGRPLGAVDIGGSPRLSADGGTVYAGEAVPKLGGRPDLFLVARSTDTGRERWRAAGLFEAAADRTGKTLWAGEYRTPGAAVNGKELPPAMVIDATTGRPVRPAPGGLPLAVSPDGRLTLTLAGSKVVVRDAATGTPKYTWSASDAGLLRESSEVAGAAFSADGQRLAVVIRHRVISNREHAAVFVCEAATGKVVWGRQTAEYLGGAAAFSPDGACVAVAGPTAKLFDAGTGKELATLDGHRGAVAALAYSPDGTRLATGGADGTAVVWDLPKK